MLQLAASSGWLRRAGPGLAASARARLLGGSRQQKGKCNALFAGPSAFSRL